ncbi:MAG: DUF2029 domain-containing protein [Planctomycetes bacterium]|nr:DUF2029 domain-containing protein [Planctomycetota bacterium]
MSEPARSPRWPLVGMALLLLAVAAVSYFRARVPRYDFHHFFGDARYVWEHGELNPNLSSGLPEERRQLPFYLPAVAVLLAPLAAFGLQPAAVVWCLGHVLALVCTLKVLAGWREVDRPRGPPRVILALACILGLPAIYEAARFNQLSFIVLALVLASVAALEKDRPARAGIWLGLATILKLLPAVFGVWLILKRKWAALGVYVATCILVATLPCLLTFGPQRTLDYHREWWAYNVRGAPAQGMTDPALREHFIDHRNQALAAVVERLTSPDHPYRVTWQPLQLDTSARRWVARLTTLLLAVGWLWAVRRPWRRLNVDAVRVEAATCALAMVIFAPLLRQYYLVWTLPALVLLVRGAARNRGQMAPRVGVVIWLIGMAAWVWPAARASGAHLLMLVALAVVLTLGLGRRRETMAAAK